jgi:hypothetical protein
MARTISRKVVLEVSCRRFFPDDNAFRFILQQTKCDADAAVVPHCQPGAYCMRLVCLIDPVR